MRKREKQQVNDFVKLLYEAHGEIREYLQKKEFEIVMDLMAQCQDCAIRLGTFIENIEGEAFVTVHHLEEYCEMMYQIYEVIRSGQADSANKLKKRMDKALIHVENSIKNDVKVRTEAVFLPYKASMWDSLESVWMAANEDEDCDAYVIPIPYYDRNPDGSFGEMHYEGEQFPESIPITHYDEYNLAQRKPDKIFIHNPYDEYNIVTSVHPAFYSKRLKEHTDELIYIPYFVLEEISPNDYGAIESMKHFCTTAGVINADKVIVQSEDMRQIYVNVLTEEMGDDTRTYWEEKILGLGSPKLDKVLRTDKENVELPKAWEKLMKKPDGSPKKVILYNTSVASLLEYEEKELKKMQSVFSFFKEQHDIVLLWRPHPLVESTILSMRPDLYPEYERIVQEYKEAGFGIYDDTADLNRAIAISDAYYGDHSSVVQLCRQAGKPVMIQNVDILERDAE